MLQPGLQCHALHVVMDRNFDMKHGHLPPLMLFAQVFVRATKLWHKKASGNSSEVKLWIQRRIVNSVLLRSLFTVIMWLRLRISLIWRHRCNYDYQHKVLLANLTMHEWQQLRREGYLTRNFGEVQLKYPQIISIKLQKEATFIIIKKKKKKLLARMWCTSQAICWGNFSKTERNRTLLCSQVDTPHYTRFQDK